MSILPSALRELVWVYSGVLAAYQPSHWSKPPIEPRQTFPVYEDSKVMTWRGYAVCRP